MNNRDIFALIRDFKDSNLALIQECLERGLDPNYELYGGCTVFNEAVAIPSDNIAVVRALINAGADVNARTHLGLTPLFDMTHFRKRCVFFELMQSGASVSHKDFLGKTILHHAVCNLKLQFAPITLPPDTWFIEKVLKHENMDCNQVDWFGQTPLMAAVKEKHKEVTDILLANAANPNISNNDSVTPLHVAFSKTPSRIELQLLQHGANIYTLDKQGQTPLDVLIQNGMKYRRYFFIEIILHDIAFKYSVTSDLKRKFEPFPELSRYFNECCDQVNRMMGDFISSKFTMHDFLCECINESDFESPLLHIHKPVVERLTGRTYSKYFYGFLKLIPKDSIVSILQMTAYSRKQAKANAEVKDLTDVVSILDITYLFSKYLAKREIFNLIDALSGCKHAE